MVAEVAGACARLSARLGLVHHNQLTTDQDEGQGKDALHTFPP